jgi:hypothetical protein
MRAFILNLQPRDEVLLDTDHTLESLIGPLRLLQLSPQWQGPFMLLACQGPNTYCLDVPLSDVARLPRIQRHCVKRLRPRSPYLHISGRHGGAGCSSSGCATAARRHMLMRRVGRDLSSDTWARPSELLERLKKVTSAVRAGPRAGPAALVAFGHRQATGRVLPRRPAPPPGTCCPSGRLPHGIYHFWMVYTIQQLVYTIWYIPYGIYHMVYTMVYMIQK